MIRPEKMYSDVRVPIDEHLLNELISRYLSISLKDMENTSTNILNVFYSKINCVQSSNNNGYNKEDLDKLLEQINEDFISAGRPFDSSKYGVGTPLGIMPGWNVFQSWNLLGTDKISSKDISHRFYFGIPNSKLYEFSKVLYDSFKKVKIPFYFKTESNPYVERTDKVVLYTSTPLLERTLDVIEKVKAERPDLINQCHEPSILTGKIDDKIGYASEDNTSKTSYTDMICQIFLNSIHDYLTNYVNNQADNQIKFMYKQKLKKYEEAGIQILSDRTKNRILFALLLQNDDNLKQDLLTIFKNNLIKSGIDINNICFNHRVKKEIEDYYGNNIRLSNGDSITADEYLRRNKVLNFIPPDSTVTLKNGMVMSGNDFIKGSLERAGNFNSFQDLVLAYVSSVDRNMNYTPKEEPINKQGGIHR